MNRSVTPVKGTDAATITEQLMLWPDELRGVPNAALRSALFAPVKPGARTALQREQIAAVGGIKIIYTGFRLDQADLDVYEQVLHLARKQPLGSIIKFRTREMLRALGRAEGKQNREWLLKSLSRLSANEIEVFHDKKAYSGSLIHEQARDEVEGMHYVVLNPSLTKLYKEGWTPIRWEQRMRLGKQQLAKWLHGFVSGQQKPLTFNIANLIELSNSSYERERDFRQALTEAAATLGEVGIDLLLRWDLKRGQVTLTRPQWSA